MLTPELTAVDESLQWHSAKPNRVRMSRCRCSAEETSRNPPPAVFVFNPTARLPLFLIAALASTLGGRVLHGEEVQADVEPGILCTFETLIPSTQPKRRTRTTSDTRVSRFVALHVSSAASPTAFLPAGRFRATFDGFLDVEFTDDYELFVEGNGAVRVFVGDDLILKESGPELSERPHPVELLGGPNRLRVEYTSPKNGAAVLRLLWASFDFRREPVPPTALSHNPQDWRLVASSKLRRGREIFVRGRCIRCHSSEKWTFARDDGMPELHLDAPSLKGIGSRLHETWIAHWISHPHVLRDTADMPWLFGEPQNRARETPLSKLKPTEEAREIARYLVSARENSGSSSAEAKSKISTFRQNPTHGRQLFHELGCVACHVTEPVAGTSGSSAAHGRLSLASVPQKWRPRALMEFLLQPDRNYRWIRMPNFHLSTNEAAALAGFLLAQASSPLPPLQNDDVDAKRGETLLRSSGCLNCHLLDEPRPSKSGAPSLESIARADASSGCWSVDESTRTGAEPRYGWSATDREALQMFLRSSVHSLRRRVAAEFTARQFLRLRCGACHARDGVVDVWSELSGDSPEARALTEALLLSSTTEPNVEAGAVALALRPDLTWAGEKLRPQWVTHFLSAPHLERVRPWLKARMPRFGIPAQFLARGMSEQHGIPPLAALPSETIDTETARVGRKLTEKDDGFNCTACHDSGSDMTTQVFNVKGPNFALVVNRLREAFFHRWMLNPSRISPASKMPRFADDEGHSPLEPYDGNARRQFEAIWEYFRTLHAARPPTRR